MSEIPPVVTTSLVLLGASMVGWLLITNALRVEHEPLHRALWAATEPTAGLVGRVGILLGLAWVLYWGVPMIGSRPLRELIAGGVLAVLAVAIASVREWKGRRRRDIDDETD